MIAGPTVEIVDLQRWMGLFRSFLLLAAFTAENYIKAIWLAKTPAPDDDDFVPKGLRTHDLTRLAREAALSLTSQQRETLKLLEKSCIWYARYTVPLNPDDFIVFGPSSREPEQILSLLSHLKSRAGSH